MKKVIFALLSAVVLLGCNGGGVKYTITVSGVDEIDDILLVDVMTMDEVAEFAYDEAAEAFICKGKADAPFIGGLTDSDGNPLTVVFVENGDISVVFDDETFAFVTSGTPSNDANRKSSEMITEFMEEWSQVQNPTPEQAEEFYVSYQNMMRSIVDENSDNIYGAYMLSNAVSAMEPAEVLEYVAKFPKALQETELLKPLKEAAEASMKVAVGSKYIDIKAQDADGSEVALSSVVGEGKWVLVDFWATWCGPCRGELPYLKAAYEKYADKGFEIFGVSLDNDIEGWKAFVPENGMTWINVIDVTPDKETPAATAYGIRSIPSNFLISPDGEIVAKDLRGEDVEKKLSEIFE